MILLLLAALLFPASIAVAQPFVKVTGTGPHVDEETRSLSGSWADFDGDGDIDLMVGSIGMADLFRNDGGDFFTRVPGPPSDDTPNLANTMPIWGDYDNDGDLDVYRCVFTRDSLGGPTEPLPNQLFRNDGGTFTAVPTSNDSTYCPAASWVDYDGDGDLDLFAAGAIGSPDLMYRNDAGTFVREEGLALLGTGPGGVLPTWTDYDQDGDADLYMVNHGSPNEMWRNLLVESGEPGEFEVDTSSGLTSEGSVVDFAVSWGDYDNDGDLDAFLATLGADRLFRNDGAGQFTRIFGIPPVQTAVTSSCGAWGDYDNDGRLDLFVPHAPSSPRAPDLWHNDGGGNFSAADPMVVGEILDPLSGPQNAEWTDYDSDGDLDLYIVTWLASGGPGGQAVANLLYRNDATGNHWLHVGLVGTGSNRSAIGAVVRVKATIGGEPLWQTREVAGGPTAFEFQRELRTHFGLGDATVVDSIVVAWPSGTVSTLTGVAVDQSLEVVEESVASAPSVTQPRRHGLRSVHPNPFLESVSIGYALAEGSVAELAVYDVAGRLVRELPTHHSHGGEATSTWDGRDQAGAEAAAGVYLVRLTTEGTEFMRKVVRLEP